MSNDNRIFTYVNYWLRFGFSICKQYIGFNIQIYGDYPKYSLKSYNLGFFEFWMF